MGAPSKRREAIRKLLQEASGPLSANELWLALQESGIGLATIYRTLKQGVEDGALREVDLPGSQARYEPADRTHHHHFLCSDCKRVLDLEGCVPGLETILPPHFRLTGHEILLFGQCDDCCAAA